MQDEASPFDSSAEKAALGSDQSTESNPFKVANDFAVLSMV